jgi:uncharacterized membrane protein YbhN (UPF0104 family)
MLFAPRGDGRRRRRGTDVGRLVVAILGVLVLGLLLTARQAFQASITEAVHPPALGLSWVFTALWIASSLGTVLLIIAMTLLSHRLDVLRDGSIAAAFALGFCVAFQQLFGVSANLSAKTAVELPGVDLGFPVLLLAIVAALAFVALPFLARGLQRVLELVIALAFVSGLVHGVGLPFALLGSLAVGWGAAAAARLIFGSPTGLPSPADVGALVAALGLKVDAVVPAKHQDWGLARYDAHGDEGEPLLISLYGRDAQQSQLFAKLYRWALFRQDSAPFSFTRAQQVEHECYMTLLAATAAPERSSVVLGSGMVGPERDGIVVTRRPPGRSLVALKEEGAVLSDAALRSLCGLLRDLHAEGLAHQSIDPARLYVAGDQGGMSDFDRAQFHASVEAQGRDLAALMTSMAMLVGVERAVAATREVLGAEQLASALAFLQSPALPSALSAQLRREHHKALLKELRKAGAEAAEVEEPKVAEIHRISWTTLILVVGTLIGAWALIGVFLNVANSFSTIMNANWSWVIITALLSQLAYFGSALSTMGSVLAPLPYFPVVVLELSNTFSGLALGTPAVMAARIRFFQKQGIDTSIAVSSGVLVSTASWIVKGGLFLISLPFALGAFHFSSLTSSSSSHHGERLLELTLLIVVGIGILIAVVLAVPRWRKLAKDQLVPRLHEVLSHFKILVRRPINLVEIFGGMLLAQLVVALALGASLHAFDAKLSLPVLIVVLTMGSVLGGLSPVPGGMGVVEAGMILGLKAAGIPDDIAVSAVFVQRLFTAYLPPVAGWFALMWLRRKEYL